MTEKDDITVTMRPLKGRGRALVATTSLVLVSVGGLLTPLVVPWAFFFGPNAAGLFGQRPPHLPGYAGPEVILGVAASIAVLSTLSPWAPMRRALGLMALLSAFGLWGYMIVLVVAPRAVGALPGSGYVPSIGFWAMGAACVALLLTAVYDPGEEVWSG